MEEEKSRSSGPFLAAAATCGVLTLCAVGFAIPALSSAFNTPAPEATLAPAPSPEATSSGHGPSAGPDDMREADETEGESDETVTPVPDDNSKASSDEESDESTGASDGEAPSEPRESEEKNTEAEERPSKPVIHIVQPEDTLSSISARYGVSVDAIAKANKIRDVNLIYDDSALKIPQG